MSPGSTSEANHGSKARAPPLSPQVARHQHVPVVVKVLLSRSIAVVTNATECTTCTVWHMHRPQGTRGPCTTHKGVTSGHQGLTVTPDAYPGQHRRGVPWYGCDGTCHTPAYSATPTPTRDCTAVRGRSCREDPMESSRRGQSRLGHARTAIVSTYRPSQKRPRHHAISRHHTHTACATTHAHRFFLGTSDNSWLRTQPSNLNVPPEVATSLSPGSCKSNNYSSDTSPDHQHRS